MEQKQMQSTGQEISADTARITMEYYNIIHRLFGIPPVAAYRCGMGGGEFFDAEFGIRGVAAYSDSLMLPLRNIYYRSNCLDVSWDNVFSKAPLPEPIVDFGAGVGMLCAKLMNAGHIDVYAVELPGLQHQVLTAAAETFGFEIIDDPLWVSPKTIISTNVLEHLPNPLQVLENWYANGVEYVYANCDLHDQKDHIAPVEERQKVNDLLRQRKTLLGEYGV